MLKVYVNGADITNSVEYGSIQTTEQLNNRRNTARFRVIDTTVEEAQLVKIFKGSAISPVSAGASSVTIDDTFETSGFYFPGKEIRIGYGTASEEVKTVLSVNYTAKTVTFTSALRSSHSSGDLIGEEVFAGVTLKNPQESIGKSDVSSFQVDAADFSSLLDQKNVVDTFADMYAREIIGRIVYQFAADDSRLDLNDCETTAGMTYSSGSAPAPTLSTDCIYKTKSVNIGALGAGAAKYRFPITGSPVDLSGYDRLRLWIKLPEFATDYVSAIKIRAFDATAKYFEWTDSVLDGPGWSYDSFDFVRASWVGGVPDRTTISSFEVELTAKKTIPIGTFKVDRIFATSGGFTIRNVSTGNILFKDVRAQYKKPSVVIESLAKNNGFAWYVSTSKDLAFFASEKRVAPFSVTDTSKNFGKLKVTADITNLKNRQTVRGGQAPDSVIYDQTHVCDGQETSYRLDYPPKDLSISVDTGSGFVAKTVGVENLVPDSSVDFVFNFSEKTVRNGAQSVLPANSKIKLSYYPYKDIRVQVRDDLSISAMKALLGGDGIFDGAVISDASIKTFEEGRSRAKAEIKAYSNPILTASFETESDGLEAGQVIRITYGNFSVDADFVIQKVDARQKGIDGFFTYSVTCGSTMYGLTEFFQYLLKKTETGNIDAEELVDVVQTTDDVITISDSWITRKKSSPFYVHARTGDYAATLTFTEGGTANDAYADFAVCS